MERTTKNESLVTRIEHTQRIRQINNFFIEGMHKYKIGKCKHCKPEREHKNES